jgi:hypothetical protein
MSKESQTLNSAIIQDGEIKCYLAEHSKIQSKITMRTRELAKQQNLIFDNLEDLAKDLKVNVEEIEQELNNYTFLPNTFFGKEHENKNYFFYHAKGTLLTQNPIAYDCPECGIVKGPPKKESYNTMIGAHSGSKGVEQKCYICNYVLKDDIERIR